MGGAKSYAQSNRVHNACKQAIESVYPHLKNKIEWKSPHKCMLYKQKGGLTNNCKSCRCGTSWATTTLRNTPCPSKTSFECKSGETCFAHITKK